MSLSMFLYPAERIQDPDFSNGSCAQTRNISNQRYLAAELPGESAYISVLAYALHDDGYCKELNGRTIAAVDILQTKSREQKMVAVNASEMAKKIATTGSVALYGIYFDFNKADLKPESNATLDQIAQLLKNDAALKLLVVGHTDNVGTFDFNTGLSNAELHLLLLHSLENMKSQKRVCHRLVSHLPRLSPLIKRMMGEQKIGVLNSSKIRTFDVLLKQIGVYQFPLRISKTYSNRY